VCSTIFNHIQDAPEFGIYKESMIVSPENLEYLKKVDEFNEEEEYILAVKNWLNETPEEILEKVMEYTGFTNYEFLYKSENSARTNVYRVYK
jgi:hypothetical protein